MNTFNTPIIRLEEWHGENIPSLLIEGLNLLASNNIKVSECDDPRVQFIHGIVQTYKCFAHVGFLALNDLIDSLDEPLGPSDGRWVDLPVGLHGGTFYIYPDQDKLGAILFDPEILFDKNINATSLLEYLLRCDAFSLYVAVEPDQILPNGPILQKPFTTEDEWISRWLTACRMIITTSGDNWLFDIYPNSPSDIELLHKPLEHAIHLIEQSEWYQENRDRLEWDDGPDLCLKLRSV